jgi:hypothetical protein
MSKPGYVEGGASKSRGEVHDGHALSRRTQPVPRFKRAAELSARRGAGAGGVETRACPTTRQILGDPSEGVGGAAHAPPRRLPRFGADERQGGRRRRASREAF